MADGTDLIRERAIAIFAYLRALAQFRQKPVRDVNSYPRVLWFYDLPREKGCHTIAWQTGELDSDEVWLEVQRIPEPPIPVLPPECKGWVDESSLVDTTNEPALMSEIAPADTVEDQRESTSSFIQLDDHPEVQSAWDSYLQHRWLPWRERKIVWVNVQDAYARLFAIHQDIQRLGENYELVVGLGYLTWKHPARYTVRRHLLVAQAALDFDAARGCFSVRPSSNGAQLALELDFLDPQDRMQLEDQKAIEADVAAIFDTPWDRAHIDEVLSKVAHTLSDRGVYSDSLAPQSDGTENPQVCLAPALILRQRSSRTQIAALDAILAQLRAGKPIPATVRMLTGAFDSRDCGGEVLVEGQSEKDRSGDGVFFPLPANDEQLEIVEKIERHQGVLVQGPPGTGKSHTIANLVCHFLATGRRVLITAQTPRALKVLQDKLPEGVLPLCVSVLGSDREALESLEQAVLGISSRWSNWDKKVASMQIQKLEAELERTLGEKTMLEGRLRQVRESETYDQSVADNSYRGTAQQIAARLARESDRYGWLRDEPTEDTRLTLGTSALEELRRAYVSLTPEREAELGQGVPDLANLPSEDEFRDWLRAESHALEELSTFASVLESRNYKALATTSKACAHELLDLLLKLRARRREIESRPLPWAREAVLAVLGEQDRPWYALRESTEQVLRSLRERAAGIEQHHWQWPEGQDLIRLRADAEDLKSHLQRGGGFGLPGFRPGVVKRTRYLTETVFLDGRVCRDVESLRQLIEVTEVLISLEKLLALWEGRFLARQETPSLRAAEFEEQLEALELIIQLSQLAKSAQKVCDGAVGLVPPDWADEVEIDALIKCCEAMLAREALEKARTQLEGLLEVLKKGTKAADPHSSFRELINAVEKRDESSYQTVLRLLRELDRDRELLDARRHSEESFRKSAPILARELAETAEDPIWDKRLIDLPNAWNWARVNAWLRRLHAERQDGTLDVRLKDLGERVGELQEKLVAELAWFHCFNRMTQSQREHLVAWQQAIKRIGKGTGKYAEKHRKDAQGHLDKCREAIPAWIMPLYRVYETVPPASNAFDVVVVDEASQCGPDSLIVTYLGRKLIIVGDDQQISPEAVGIDRSAVYHLIQQYLSDVVHADSYSVEGSLFAHGQIRYGDRIVLREHFRCMPEIIRFSNDLCYRGQPLIPLRRYPPDRLRPVVTVSVPTGTAEGSDSRVINRIEAERLVRAVLVCARDPRYDGKTFGVISLQGEMQARLIEDLLLDEMDSREIADRLLICGDAYSFQGDERDVMFLSLVAASNRRIGALTKETDKRRFNVASSRARDQMWLFHSVFLHDLGQDDLRHILLKYCLNPALSANVPSTISLEELRGRAMNERRDRGYQPKPFDSWFEVDVFLDLVDRGFRVIPQYPVAGYRIDLVVEGNTTQLAVECDGDQWHGPETDEADASRQRVLERCGWVFRRVVGSVFCRQRVAVVDEIVEAAHRLGIEPLGQGDVGAPCLEGYCPDIDWATEEARPAAPRFGLPPDSNEIISRREAHSPVRTSGKARTSGAQVVREKPPFAKHVPAFESSSLKDSAKASVRGTPKTAKQLGVYYASDDEIVAWAMQVPAKTWFELSHWARENDKLQPWQRSLLYDVGCRVARDVPVSVKQARQAKKAYDLATEAGFKPSDES